MQINIDAFKSDFRMLS